MSLFNLSDEILVIIFECVSGGDRVNLSKTCIRFNQILKDKKLTRNLKFVGCYSTVISDIKTFLRPKLCYENVQDLDLTSCYWLCSADIRQCVLKLVNLHALYAADTALSREHLFVIISKLSKLKRLSWTWNSTDATNTIAVCKDIKSISTRLHSFEFLFFYVKTDQFKHYDLVVLCNWLSRCHGLKELWVIVPAQERNLGFHTQDLNALIQLHFPELHTLVLSLAGCARAGTFLNSLFSLIMDGCRAVNLWRCYWVSKAESALLPGWPKGISEAKTLLMTHSDTKNLPYACPKLEHLALVTNSQNKLVFQHQSLKKIFWNPVRIPLNWDSLCNSITNLEELNVTTCIYDVTNAFEQKTLRKLAIPICIFKGNDEGCSLSSEGMRSSNAFQIIVETCPNIQEFELTPCSYCSYRPSSVDQESSLELIAKWTRLRRLKLEGLDCVRSGKFFVQIFKMCTELEGISLKHLGLLGKCSYLYEFSQALQFCKNLKDLRIEQPNMMSTEGLFKAMLSCNKMERICIISARQGKPPKEAAFTDLLARLPKLIFLYVALDAFTQVACKRITRDLSNRFLGTRPALHITLLGVSKEAFRNVHLPGIHYFEMREDVSRISTKPWNGNRYLSHA